MSPSSPRRADSVASLFGDPFTSDQADTPSTPVPRAQDFSCRREVASIKYRDSGSTPTAVYTSGHSSATRGGNLTRHSHNGAAGAPPRSPSPLRSTNLDIATFYGGYLGCGGFEPSRRSSKYSFVPTPVQSAIHNFITAPQHRAPPGDYHSSVRFPVWCTGAIDSSFHPVRDSPTNGVAWLNDGGINMLNFSAGVSVPKTTPPSSVGTLIDAARSLCRYSQEYFVDDVRDVFEALLDFMQQLDGWHTWSPPDLPHLVFWVNSVLEEMRHLVYSSNGNLDMCSRHAVARLSLNDGDLQNVMHALARRPTSSAVITQRPQSAGAVRQRGTQRQQRIPPAFWILSPSTMGYRSA
ncbi:unnamed protein product [Phytophthora lilii]|uniref:Unnamed protein product n=1 Tax=Phytophthora lilii TaxID=2077276 RepID=A0A9W6UAC7_9STRA|nr:unnamed protein product [Phytophthora lilii]